MTKRQILKFEVCEYEILIMQEGDGPVVELSWKIFDNKKCGCCGHAKDKIQPLYESKKKYNFFDFPAAIEDALKMCSLQRLQNYNQYQYPITWSYCGGSGSL